MNNTDSDTNPYQAPEVQEAPRERSKPMNLGPQGIGGWLVLVAIGVLFSPVKIVMSVFPMYAGIISDGTWEALTTSSGEFYDPALASVLALEAFINFMLLLSWIYINYLFFTKRKRFVKWYISVVLFTLVFIVVDALVVGAFIVTDDPTFDPETKKEIMRSFIGACIWVPYMLKSQRVQATFTH